jgi:predicted nucleic acid-binding protein
MKRIYLETSIFGYLTARPTRDLTAAAMQEWTQEWWDLRAGQALFSSELVSQEASAGDPEAASRRVLALEGIPFLAISDEAIAFAHRIRQELKLSEKSGADCLHMAIATVHKCDVLLTWNCKHIANAVLRPRFDTLCRLHGWEPPLLCTPAQLLEWETPDD